MNRLKALREAQNLSQAELGAILSCSDVTISRYETGRRDIDSETVCRLCDIFSCTADYLLCRSQLATPELSEEEEVLLQAFRRADEDRREIVRTALAPFREEPAEESAM